MEDQAKYETKFKKDQVAVNHQKVGDAILEAMKSIDQAIIYINAGLPEYDYEQQVSKLLKQKSELKETLNLDFDFLAKKRKIK